MTTKKITVALMVIVGLYIAYRLIKKYNGYKRRKFEQEDVGQVDRVIYRQPTQYYSVSPSVAPSVAQSIVNNPRTATAQSM